VIQEVEQGGAESPTVRVHPLKNIDATAALEVLENLFARQHPTVELSTSPRGDHLVAIARPEQHAMIEATLKQLQTEELDVEIFQLERIDPYTAETAIVSLFSENFWDAPMVEVDMNMQQLFVRAKREQLDQIRELLVKMGETQLAAASQTRKNVRVVPFQGDTEAALTEIRRVWPSLRKNTIRVLEPSEPPKAPPEPGEKPATPPPPKKPPNSASTTTPAVQMVSFQEAKQAGPSEKPKASENQENTKNADNAESPHKSEIKEKSESSQPLPKPAEPAPVIVVPGEGSITIASDDPEALRQMEALLRGLSQGTPTHGGRNHSIFVLQHADATEVAETLQQLFKTQPGRYRRREIVPTLIVANEQLNAVVVHGNRADREEIGKLIEVFDSPELATSLRPTMIPIANTKAERIEEVVREVFRADFGFGRGRGTSSLQAQLAVDEMTNSLVVMARGPLVEEVTRLAQSLDEAAGKSPARSLKIISLKNTNATRIEEALDTLLQDSIRRYRRRY